MRRVLFLFLVLVLSEFAIGQDLTGIKIYVNPGHGGFDSNDRNIPETGFWESVSNLDKGLALRTILQELNATVYMSRVTNTSADDLALSTIVADCNAHNVDYFHAIHSNGYNGQSNYTLLLFQGFDNGPTYPAAKTMGGYVLDEIYKANRTTAKYLRGDFDFYRTGQPYLGVFKNLNVPGTLSEGEFHDYIPESWRLMNLSYKKHEAWAIARGFLKYFAKPGFSTGIAAGLVRDANKTVSYFALTSKSDNKLPINNVKITLEPGGLVYHGDDMNNGFYLFDSLAPGNYKVYFEAPGYYKDSSSISIAANSTSFADKFLQFDTTAVASVIGFSPSSSIEPVKTTTPVVINFDLPMDSESTNTAFSIAPEVSGTIAWSNGNKQLTFKPDYAYTKATEYTVTLAKTAKTIWNIPLAGDLVFKFTTTNRDRYKLESTYPQLDSKISVPLPQFRLQFDAPIWTGSLAGQINLYDATWTRLTAVNVKIFSENNKGYIFFETKNPLTNGEYILSLGGKIADTDSIPMVDSVDIHFTVDAILPTQVTLVDDFEAAGGWQSPKASQYSVGIDTTLSQFLVTTEKKAYGTKSGKLSYTFVNNSDGECVVENNLKPDAKSSFVGVWVFGDLSNNIVKLWFEDNSGFNFSAYYDSLNWAGWKFLTVDSSFLSGQVPSKIYALSVEQNGKGAKNGIIYFDNIQTFTVTDVDEQSVLHPSRFVLAQNFPNPFNPETAIRFSIPEGNTSFVSLKIYDVLGREVATLINEWKNPGNYSVNWDASAVNSGVYFYQLHSGNKTLTKKMLLLK